MEVRVAKENEIKRLTEMSIAAFKSDVLVGATEEDGPPEYDNEAWHMEMMKGHHLYSFLVDQKLIGGALVFRDENCRNHMYLGRIFVDPTFHGKGYGLEAMGALEELFSDITEWFLDTPEWNNRTNRFYQKLGYHQVKVEDGFVFYEKKMG